LEVAALLCGCSGRPAELDLWVRAANLARTSPSLGSLDRLVTEGLGRTTDAALEFDARVLAAFGARARPRARAMHAAIARALEERGTAAEDSEDSGESAGETESSRAAAFSRRSYVRRRHTRLARHQLASGQTARARANFVRAAELRLRALDPAEARALLEERSAIAAVVDEPDEWSIRVALLESALARSRGDRAAARTHAKRAHRLARSNDLLFGAATLHRARVERWAGAPEVALRLLLELQGRPPLGVDRATLELDQVRVLLELGALDRAHRILEASEPDPRGAEQPMRTLLRARVRRLQGDASAGLRLLDAFVAVPAKRRDAATRAALQHELGEIQVDLGNLGSAVAAFRSALETLTVLGADAAPDAELSLGLALAAAGELQPAFAHVTGALGAWRERADERAHVWSVALAWMAALGEAWPLCAKSLDQARPSRDARWRGLLDRVEALGQRAKRSEIVAATRTLRRQVV
jgi:tetratricopeptide (TPR) repeat protein